MILHADADAFFASVEQRDDPRLRGRPTVVAHEVVACPSYEARALGIHAGMPLRQVQRRWPEVLVTGSRPEAYEEASAALFEVFRRFTPLVEPGSACASTSSGVSGRRATRSSTPQASSLSPTSTASTRKTSSAS